MGNFAVIDIVFSILIVLLLVHGFVKGFIDRIFSWGGLVLAVWLAVLLHPQGADFIRSRVMSEVRFVPEILAFVAIFAIVMIGVKLLERILKNIVDGAHLGGIDKLLGLVFGLVEGITLTMLVIFLLSVQPVFDVGVILNESFIAGILHPLIRHALERGEGIINTTFILDHVIRFSA
jgi:membrane protein required for colicin V production